MNKIRYYFKWQLKLFKLLWCYLTLKARAQGLSVTCFHLLREVLSNLCTGTSGGGLSTAGTGGGSGYKNTIIQRALNSTRIIAICIKKTNKTYVKFTVL